MDLPPIEDSVKWLSLIGGSSGLAWKAGPRFWRWFWAGLIKHIHREQTLISQALYIRWLEAEIKGMRKNIEQRAERAEASLASSEHSDATPFLPTLEEWSRQNPPPSKRKLP